MSLGSHAFHILKYFGISIETVRVNFIIMEKEAVLIEAIAKSPSRLTLLTTLLLVSRQRPEQKEAARTSDWEVILPNRLQTLRAEFCLAPLPSPCRLGQILPPPRSFPFLPPSAKRSCFSSQITHRAGLVEEQEDVINEHL